MEKHFQEIGEKIIACVKQMEKKIMCHYEDGFIIGSFRGKDSFKYSVPGRTFIFNKGGGNVSSPFTTAVNEVYPI